MQGNKTDVSLQELEFDIDKFFSELERRQAIQKLRKEHSYVADLIRVLVPCRNGLNRSMVLHTLYSQRLKEGLPIPDKFEHAVQSSYNQHCLDSLVFKKRKVPDSDALFYSPGGKGSGKWAVNREHAIAWLNERSAELAS